MEYKTCKTCNNHKPVVQFDVSKIKLGKLVYKGSCKWCKRHIEKSFERLYTIPEHLYTGKICNVCTLCRPFADFEGRGRGAICAKCQIPKDIASSKRYSSTENGRVSHAKSYYKAIDNLSENYVKNVLLRKIKDPTQLQIEFKRTVVLVKRKLNLTRSNERTYK